MQAYGDMLLGELSTEVDNGRLLRLTARISAVTERPDHEGDPQWSETGASSKSGPLPIPSTQPYDLCASGKRNVSSFHATRYCMLQASASRQIQNERSGQGMSLPVSCHMLPSLRHERRKSRE